MDWLKVIFIVIVTWSFVFYLTRKRQSERKTCESNLYDSFGDRQIHSIDVHKKIGMLEERTIQIMNKLDEIEVKIERLQEK